MFENLVSSFEEMNYSGYFPKSWINCTVPIHIMNFSNGRCSSPNLLINSIWTPCRVIFLPSYMVTLMRYSSQGTSKSNVTILVLGLIFFLLLMISSVRLVEQKGPKHERKLSSGDRPPPTNCHYNQ